MLLPNKVRKKLYDKIPLWIKKHDFELFTAVLCLTAGIPLLTGNVRSDSVESQLPSIIVTGWGICLVLGPIFIYLGVFKAYTGVKDLITHIFWMRLEALGLTMLAWASLVFGVCVLSVNLYGGWLAAMLTFSLFLTCLSRELYIQNKIEMYKTGVGINA